MSKAERKDSKSRQIQQQQRRQQNRVTVRKNSGGEGEQWQLGELRERGKKVLKKLLPNQPMGMIKRLVQKGADNLKKEIMANQRLLPALTTTKVQSSLVEVGQDRFQEMNKQLTNSLLFFHSNVTQNIENDTSAEVVRSHTDKCYRRIPHNFFQAELPGSFISRLLTADRRCAMVSGEQLCEYYDQFNVNQQVEYKMGVFLSFVTFLTSIGRLADLSIRKIQGTRENNRVIQQIVVQRAERVNALRRRKEEVQQYIAALDSLKNMKKLEDYFMSQVQAKGRVTTLALYADYCSIHETLKRYCCPRMLCKYWDVAYYIERGYHDSFSRSLKNYLCEIIVLQQKLVGQIMSPNKAAFATVDTLKITSLQNSCSLDESYQVEQQVQLVCKHNIEREIVSTFKEGLNKCSYSTDQVCQELKNQLAACENRFYMLIRGDSSIGIKNVTSSERKQALERLTTGKYVRLAELWSERLKKVVRRQTSIVDRALRATIELGRQQPEKEEVVTSYLMQLVEVTFGAVDQSLAFLVAGRRFKQQETDSIRQVLIYEQQWKELVIDLRHLPSLWKHLQRHFAEEQALNAEGRIVQALLGKLTSTRRKIVQLMIQSYNAKVVEKLPLQLQEEQWRWIAIPVRFYNVLGEVLYGRNFTREIQKSDNHLLSSSLLLERNSSTLSLSCQGAQRRESFGSESGSKLGVYDLQVGEKDVCVEGERFRIIGSTMGVVEGLQGYLEWVEQAGEGEKLECTVLSKIMEFLIMYNTHVKELILNKGALSFGKIRSKSITGKHLLNAYSQLKFFRTVGGLITRRFPEYAELSGLMLDRLQRSMSQVSKKFRSILQLSIRESVNKLVVDPRREISCPVDQSVEVVTALMKSCEYVRELLLEGELGQFVGVNWCGTYLEQVRGQYKSVYKQIMNSNGTRKSKDIDWTDNLYWKLKELQYLVQSLADLREHLPGFNAIIEELQQERKKLDHPQ